MAEKNYHHGDLRAALVQGARTILERDGLAALSLRACAREVGVSHAAPLHHFSNLGALLAAVATSGFEDFVKALNKGASPIDYPVDRLVDMGIAYVRFASENPSLYSIMFGIDSGHVQSEALSLAMHAAWDQLYCAVAAIAGDEKANSNAMMVWSLVHGHATLVAAGCIPPVIEPDSLLRVSLRTIAASIQGDQASHELRN